MSEIHLAGKKHTYVRLSSIIMGYRKHEFRLSKAKAKCLCHKVKLRLNQSSVISGQFCLCLSLIVETPENTLCFDLELENNLLFSRNSLIPIAHDITRQCVLYIQPQTCMGFSHVF